VCMHVYAYVCIWFVCVCMNVSMYVWGVCVYGVCMYVCVCVCVWGRV
jgi:hypothetical protein